MRDGINPLVRSGTQDWRTANGINKGTVHQVDAKAGLARLRLGGTDEKPFLGPWVPYQQTMGALKFHNPPSVGQQMFMVSTGGDYEQGVLIPLAQSNQNPSPSDKPDEHVLTFGDITISLKQGKEVEISAKKVTMKSGDTKVEVEGDDVRINGKTAITGDKLTHNDANISDTHRHTDVEPGNGLSGPPEEE